MRQLYELCGRDRDVRFSPYVWRAKLALKHKGLDFEGVPVRFLEKQPLESADSKTVPVLDDNGTWVKDSFEIARYLDETYPNAPLFGGAIAQANARMLNNWMNNVLNLGIFRMIAADIHARLDEKNAAYFRQTREKFLGSTLEEVQATRAEAVADWRQLLGPVRAALAAGPYLSGEKAAWADYALFGTFMWARIASDFELLDTEDTLFAWRERMLDMFEGYGRSAKLGFQ